MKDILNNIKYAFQRAIRGYDERIFWEFDSYFAQFIKPLEEFCLNELADAEMMKNNPEREKVYTETIRRVQDFRSRWITKTNTKKKTPKTAYGNTLEKT